MEAWVLDDYCHVFSSNLNDERLLARRTEPEVTPPPPPMIEDQVVRSDPRGSVSPTVEKPSQGKGVAMEDRGISPMSTALSTELTPWTEPCDELFPQPSTRSSVVKETPPAVEDSKPEPEQIPPPIRLVRATSRVRVIKEASPPRVPAVRASSRPRIWQSFPDPSSRREKVELPTRKNPTLIRATSRPRIVEPCTGPSVTEDKGAKPPSTIPLLIRATSRPRLVTTCPDPSTTRTETTPVESPRYVDHGDGEWIAEHDSDTEERGRSRTRNPPTSQERVLRDKTPAGIKRSCSKVRVVDKFEGWEVRSAPRGAAAAKETFMIPTKRMQTRKAAAVLSTGEVKRRNTGLPENREERSGPSYSKTEPLVSNLTKSELARLDAAKKARTAKQAEEMKAKAVKKLQNGESEKDSASVSHETASSSRRNRGTRRKTVGSAAQRNAMNKGKRNAKRNVGRDLTKQGLWPLGLEYKESWTTQQLSDIWRDARSSPFWGALGEVASRLLTEEGCVPGPLKARLAKTRWDLYTKMVREDELHGGPNSAPGFDRVSAMKIGERKMASVPRDPKYVGMQPPARWSEPDENSDDADEEEE